MSSFRVERDRVSVFPQAVFIGDAREKPEGEAKKRPARAAVVVPAPPPPDEAKNREYESEMEKLRSLKAQANLDRMNADAEAKKTLDTAKLYAEKMEADAREQAVQIKADAKEHGYSDGMRQAYEENAARKKKEATELEKLKADILRERAEIIDSLRGEIIGTVMDMTAKIIGVKLKESDELFLNIINSALNKIKQGESISVSLSTEDYIRYFFDAPDPQSVLGDKNVKIKENKSFSTGECVVETENEIIDCGVPGQLRRAEQILREEEEATPGCEAVQ